MGKRARFDSASVSFLKNQIDRELIEEADPLRASDIPGFIMVDPEGDILDGFHRVAGLVKGGAKGTVRVIRVCDPTLIRQISEPRRGQEDAIEEAIVDALL